jgi:dipeptidyl aminopeptidase/acylaminoacyl peptidase
MHKPASLLSLILFIFSLPLLAEDAPLRPITHEDVWLMKRLGEPVLSPDGRYAVVSVTEPSYEDGGDVSDLWLIDSSGKEPPRRLTATAAGESGPAWSPDGSRIAFSTTRGTDEVSQIYVLPMDGPGEAVAITSLSTGAASPKWSPDGSRIAFESSVYPGALDDEANQAEQKARDERKTNVSAYEIFPIRQWDKWRDDKQVHLFVQDVKAGATARDLLAGSELVSLKGYSGLPSLSSESLNAVWAPDGKSLVFNASTNLDQAAYTWTTFRLFRVLVAGGEPEAVAGGDDWSCHTPQFSDDGRALYCLYEPSNEHVYNLTGIARFDWPGQGSIGAPDIITSTFDRSVVGLDVSSNGKTVYLTAADAGRQRVYTVSSKGGEVRALDGASRGVYAGAQSAGQRLLARWESSAVPAEIVAIDPKSGRHRALTRFNTERAAELDMPAFEEFWFESSKGRRIHSWIALPAGFDESRKYPLVLQIHGGPFASSMDSSHVRWSAGLMAAPGYVVLMTDYTGSVGYGQEFSRNIQRDPLKTPGEELLEAADAAIERYPFIDGERQAATGASYGGHLVNWLQGNTNRFRALVGHAGLVDLEGQYTSSDTIYGREVMNGGPPWSAGDEWREQSPATYANAFSTPILLTIGEKDYRVPINQTISAWSYVQRKQVPGRLLVFHDANHWIMKGEEARYFWDEVFAWLDRYLGSDTF